MIIFLLSVIAIPALSYILLKNNDIQNYLAQKIKYKLETFLGTKINLGHISFDMLNRVVIEDVIAFDNRSDTLLSAPKLTFAIENISLSKRNVHIGKIELTNARVHFYIDSARMLNLEYIIDKVLEDSDSTKPGWLVEFDNLGLIDSYLRIEDSYKGEPGKGINFSDMQLNNLNIRVKDLTVLGGLATFKINRLAFKEISGFEVNNISGRMRIGRHLMHLSNVNIKTPNSEIFAPRLYFDHNKFGDFKDFPTKVNIDFAFRESHSSLSDIRYFLDAADGMDQNFSFSGLAKGVLSDLKCKKFNIKTGKNTSFTGNIFLWGLPDIEKTDIYFESAQLVVDPADVESVLIPALQEKHVIVPEQLKKLGIVTYEGSFKGFANDFVTYGSFFTKLGIVNTDLSLKPLSDNKISINGKMSSNNIDWGTLLNKPHLLGKSGVNLNADVVIENSSKVTGTFNASLYNLFFNNYAYQNIEINGSLKENAFDGIVKVKDENLTLSSAGFFNFTGGSPVFNFSATVSEANPFALKLTSDSINYFSGQLIANFKGRNIDSIDGEIGLANLLFRKNKQSLSIRNIFIKSINSTEEKVIDIQSDMFSATLKGSHDLSSLSASALKYFRYYLPNSFYSIPDSSFADINNFSFKLTSKESKPLLDFFANGSDIAPKSTITGIFQPRSKVLKFSVAADYVQTNGVRFNNLDVQCSSNIDSLWIDLRSDQSLIGDKIKLFQSEAHASAHSNKSNLQLLWKDSIGHSSNLGFLTHFQSNKSIKPTFIVDIVPSNFFILNELWKIDSSSIAFDTSCISTSVLRIHNNKQNVFVHGSISETYEDKLYAEFSNFNLNIVNFLLNSSNLKLNGNIDGKLQIQDFYKTNRINIQSKISEFAINNELLGQAEIEAKIDRLSKKIEIEAHSETEDGHKTEISGHYFPDGNVLDFNCSVQKTGVKIFQPFIESLFAIKKGYASGTLTLKGTANEPLLNADLDIDSAIVTLKQLNTTFSFNTPFRILNNKFLLKNIKLFDSENNICKLDGYIDNKNFTNFQLYINLLLDKNLVMDLSPNDNFPFYGKGYASGIVRITGQPDQVYIDVIRAKTEKNTVFYLPLNTQTDIVTNDFVTFNTKKNVSVKKTNVPQKYEVKTSGLVLNIDVEVSPEAEVQLVFDPALGDIMRAQGSGNLKIELDKSGNFTIRGNYIVKSGDYLFTLQNLLNKKFIINQGGSIVFNGSPLDATIDITAVYKTRASLYNLFLDQEYKKRIPIECQLFLSNKLLNPSIRYDIDLPNAVEETKNKLREIKNNEQELSKQFISLLVLNNFMPSGSNTASLISRDAATTTSIEMLSSQVSNWISQINEDFDLGVNYRPGDKSTLTNQEVEVALSTQLLDDRMSINGNLDFIGNQVATTNSKAANLVGDVNVEFKLTDKVLLKAFNRPNDQMSYQDEVYTRGFGIAYREEFRNLTDLRQRYYQLLFAPKKKIEANSDTSGVKK